MMVRLENSGWPGMSAGTWMLPRSPEVVGNPHHGVTKGCQPGISAGAGPTPPPPPREGPGTGALDQPGALSPLGPQLGTEPPPQGPMSFQLILVLHQLSWKGLLVAPRGTCSRGLHARLPHPAMGTLLH